MSPVYSRGYTAMWNETLAGAFFRLADAEAYAREVGGDVIRSYRCPSRFRWFVMVEEA